MLLIILSYLGGALTIVSPCILPVLPFVFARTGQPFRRSGLPLLAGMALTFALVATLAAVGGGWVVQANQYGRWAAMALMAFFGLTLLLPHLADRLTKPLVALGDRLSRSAQDSGEGGSIASSFLLGIATGLLLAYAAGAATSLAVALLIGGKVFTAMKRSLGAGEWIRRGLGGAMLLGVAAIAMGWDTGVLAQVSTVATGGLEEKLINALAPRPDHGGAMMAQNGGAMMSQNTGAMSQNGGAMMSQDAAAMSQNGGAMMSQNAGAMSQNGGAMMAMHAAAPATETLGVEGK